MRRSPIQECGFGNQRHGKLRINGVTYKYVLSNDRPWKLSSLDGSVYVSGAGVKLWVQNAFNLPSNGEIRIPAATACDVRDGRDGHHWRKWHRQ